MTCIGNLQVSEPLTPGSSVSFSLAGSSLFAI
jgi:hypothetical protein